MRKWSQLKTMRQKRKRLLYSIWNFLKWKIWGGYHAGGLNGLYHWIRCHTWNRYHIVNVSGIDGYKWGWIDRDHVLLYASFVILSDFVEKEDPTVGLRTLADYMCKCDDPECCSHDNDKNCMLAATKAQIEREKEIRAIYDWWKVERPRDHEECRNILDGVEVKFGDDGVRLSDEKKSHSWYEREQELHKKDEEMLIRLAKIRQSLWT